MTLMQRGNLAVSLFSLFALGVTQGCAARAHPRPDVLPAGIDVAIDSGADPIVVRFVESNGKAASRPCHATRIGGYSTGRVADTVRLAWIASVTPVVAGDSACAILSTADVALSATTTIVPHNNLSRGNVALIGAVGLAAFALLVIKGIAGTRGNPPPPDPPTA